MTVSEALVAVRARIDAAAEDAGRDPRDVTLVAVTKSVAVDAIREVLAAGVTDVGENRAQDLVAKARALGADGTGAPRWHFIGRLQRNKVRTVAPYVALWQSVDRHELATEIAGLVARCRAHGLDVEGLMTVPPDGADPSPIFATVRRLSDELGLATCSMGMSGDYERAIRAGATMVRVGSAIFGPRPADSDARR
jgi:uncharacterized pyridoxal phosphate-containing UPF0001 family protein